MVVKEIQLGKNGITQNFLGTLEGYFSNCRTVKVSVLKSARENKEDIKKLSEELLKSLGANYTAKVIGFKIVLKKWRKPKINSEE